MFKGMMEFTEKDKETLYEFYEFPQDEIGKILEYIVADFVLNDICSGL